MGERTINGKAISQIEKELKAKIPQTEEYWGGKTENGRFSPQWIKGEAYEKIFNEVVGSMNYSREPSPVEIVQVGDKQNAAVHMKVTIFDDEGKVVCIKGANGSNEIGNGDLKSNYASAETEAFKHLCQDMGMGAGQQDFVTRKDKINGQKDAAGQTRQAPQPAGSAPSDGLPQRGSEVTLTFLEPFGNGQRFRTASAVDAEGRNLTVKLFSDKHQLIEEASGQTIEAFFAMVKKGFVLKCKGEYRQAGGGLEFAFWGL